MAEMTEMVKCQSLQEWENGGMSSFPLLGPDTIHVGWVDASAVTPDAASLSVLRLPEDEQTRFHRYKRPLDAHQFLVGRLLLRGWLEQTTGVSAAAWRLREGDRGRPEIADPPSPYTFNLAHSGGMVACGLAVSDEGYSPECGIGIDLEDLQRRPMTRDLARRFCAPIECADIDQQPPEFQTARFLTYWTLKEAYLKARGLGIAVHLADIAFRLEPQHPVVTFRESLIGTSADWAFALFQPTSRYLLSVAAPQPAGAPRPQILLHAVSLATLGLA
jgi:4'-phosphopantetheinyl transferase